MKLSQIEVSEIQGNPSAAAREGAMLFANGQTAQAAERLQKAIGAADAPDSVSWRMLLDLHRLNDDVRAFESLAQRYAQVFERAPPPWDVEARDSALPPELRRGGPACCELSNRLDETIAQRLTSLRSSAKHHAIIRFDLRELRSVDENGCALLSAELDRLVSHGNGVVFAGAERLEQLLCGALADDARRQACWRLMLDLLQILGRQSEHETCAMEYAIAIQVEPPPWQTLFLPQLPATAVEEKRHAPRYQAGPELFNVSGSMGGARDAQLLELMQFALEKTYVNIHLGALLRMDFVCAGHFVNTLAAWKQNGKTVRLIRANTLVAALLIMLDAPRYAKFVPEREEA